MRQLEFYEAKRLGKVDGLTMVKPKYVSYIVTEPPGQCINWPDGTEQIQKEVYANIGKIMSPRKLERLLTKAYKAIIRRDPTQGEVLIRNIALSPRTHYLTAIYGEVVIVASYTLFASNFPYSPSSVVSALPIDFKKFQYLVKKYNFSATCCSSLQDRVIMNGTTDGCNTDAAIRTYPLAGSKSKNKVVVSGEISWLENKKWHFRVIQDIITLRRWGNFRSKIFAEEEDI